MKRSPGEKRNDERMKLIVRDWLQRQIDSQEHLLSQLLDTRRLMPLPYVDMAIKGTEERIGVLIWLIAMTRPADPNTVNQWNMQDGTQEIT